MRRMILLLLTAGLLAGIAGCGGAPAAKVPTLAPIPTKTARPTFTYTPVLPTATRLVPTPTAIPSATPVLATNTPEVTPTSAETRALLTANDIANVRSGPGTAYPKIGQLQAGQEFEITGKNSDGDWWQFSLNGKPGWVAASMVTANDLANGVPVAEAPAAPAAPVVQPPRPQPQPQPQPQPTQPPAPTTAFGQAGAEIRNADNTYAQWVTFWGRLGNPGGGPVANASSYKLRVSIPSGNLDVPFRDVFETAYAGQRQIEFKYNAKAELPRTAGAYKAVVIDGGGKEVSDAISGTLLDRTHDVILTWLPR